MEFKCKNCGKDKYRQINPFVKQCLFCGRNIFSSGTKSEDLDWTNEIIENESKPYAKFKFYDSINYNTSYSYKELLEAMEELMNVPMGRIGRNVVNE